MDGTQTKITVFVAWIGDICNFHYKSIESLLEIKRFRVVLISNNYFPRLSSDVIQLSFESAFNRNNRFGVLCNELIASPYKLCDLKPWLPQLFNVHKFIDEFWGWADIDLLISYDFNSKLSFLDSNQKTVYGSWGHLMFGHKDAMQRSSELLYNKLMEQGSNYWDLSQSYALDERNYFHKALDYLQSKGELSWEKNFIRVGDLDPNWYGFKVKWKFYKYLLIEDNNFFLVSKRTKDYYDYVHFQHYSLETFPINCEYVYSSNNKTFSTNSQRQIINSFFYHIRVIFRKTTSVLSVIERKRDINFD